MGYTGREFSGGESHPEPLDPEGWCVVREERAPPEFISGYTGVLQKLSMPPFLDDSELRCPVKSMGSNSAPRFSF